MLPHAFALVDRHSIARTVTRFLTSFVAASLLSCSLPARAQVEAPALAQRFDGLGEAVPPPAGTTLRYTLDSGARALAALRGSEDLAFLLA